MRKMPKEETLAQDACDQSSERFRRVKQYCKDSEEHLPRKPRLQDLHGTTGKLSALSRKRLTLQMRTRHDEFCVFVQYPPSLYYGFYTRRRIFGKGQTF